MSFEEMNMSAIYKIQSKAKPSRFYIGSAASFRLRRNLHLSRLRRKIYDNPKLQAHFNKYGELDLVFSILQVCNKSNLIKIEQYYLDECKPWFNICKIASSRYGTIVSEETRIKMSISHKKRYQLNPRSEETRKKISRSSIGKKMSKEAKKKMSDHWKIPITQYDKNNNFIKHWDSAKEAQDELNISGICHVLKGRRFIACGYKWKYKQIS